MADQHHGAVNVKLKPHLAVLNLEDGDAGRCAVAIARRRQNALIRAPFGDSRHELKPVAVERHKSPCSIDPSVSFHRTEVRLDLDMRQTLVFSHGYTETVTVVQGKLQRWFLEDDGPQRRRRRWQRCGFREATLHARLKKQETPRCPRRFLNCEGINSSSEKWLGVARIPAANRPDPSGVSTTAGAG